jgi:hypothetical protein
MNAPVEHNFDYFLVHCSANDNYHKWLTGPSMPTFQVLECIFITSYVFHFSFTQLLYFDAIKRHLKLQLAVFWNKRLYFNQINNQGLAATCQTDLWQLRRTTTRQNPPMTWSQDTI